MGTEPHRYTKVEAADDFMKRMKHVQEEAQSALTKAKEEMKRYADFHRGEPPKYKVGDKVWLETEHLKIAQPSNKLSEKRIGPYPITEIKSSNARVNKDSSCSKRVKCSTLQTIHDLETICSTTTTSRNRRGI